MPSELGKRILLIVARRGYTGADREAFFHDLRGIRYRDLEREVLSLERDGDITIEWVGPSNFTVFITPKGVELATSFQKDVWHKSTEALEKLERTKHEKKEVSLEEVGYSKIMEEKLHVEEVGAISDEIIEKIDDQIMAEREASYDEESYEEGAVGVGVPAVEEIIEEEDYEAEEGVVERRLPDDMEIDMTEEGESISSPLEDLVKEGLREGRIAAEKGITYERIVKEKRISGELKGGVPPPRPEKIPVKEKKRPISVTDRAEEKSIQKEPAVEEEVEEEVEAEERLDWNEPPPYFSYHPDTEKSLEESVEPQPEPEPISASQEANCIWEPNQDCHLLQSNEIGLAQTMVQNKCIICLLLKIKHLLEK